MGLPQELVDLIVSMLSDDIPALKACSLTCKAMFVSTQHLIHRTLRLPNDPHAREQKLRYLRWNTHNTTLYFLSQMAERGLLQHTQRIHIRMARTFTPGALLPHLHHLQSLDRVHTLIIEHCNPILWESHFETCFAHFYPTLTSLTLSRPTGPYQTLLRFALQFPNLENLCLEWMTVKITDIPIPPPGLIASATADQRPPLRGHLRLAGYGTALHLPTSFILALPNGMGFRSVELEKFFGFRARHILNACGRTLEHLTVIPEEAGACRVPCFQWVWRRD